MDEMDKKDEMDEMDKMDGHIAPKRAPSAEDLRSHIIYRCVVGSRAFGLDEEGSDTDVRGIYLAPAGLHWSLNGAPEQIIFDKDAECYWELQKFLTLALKANPNILECLYTPLVEFQAPLAEELREIRGCFLSKRVYHAYHGYVQAQFVKMEHAITKGRDIRWKHAVHLLRLLLSGAALLREGWLPLRVSPEERERLLNVRHGRMLMDEIHAWRMELHAEFEHAFAATRLPDEPDFDAANEFLLRARRWAATL